MPREIIHVQVGQCGNQVGNAFWNTIMKDHELSTDGIFTGTDHNRLDNIGVYFDEDNANNRYVPRACFVDFEPGIMDILKASPLSNVYKLDNMIFGCSSSRNRSPISMIYTHGAELLDEAVDIIRKEAESCDCLQGLQLIHSIAGYTGSFAGSLLLLKIRDNYPDKITTTCSIFPSKKVSDVVVEPYNAILCIHQLLENSDETFVIGNEALFNMSHNMFKQKEPKYADLNWIAAMIMCGCTASLRFKCELNSTLRRMGSNLVPFPRLHFFSISHAPLLMANTTVQLRVPELLRQLKSNTNVSVLLSEGKVLSTTSIYRGDIEQIIDETSLIDMFINYIQLKYLKDTIVPTSIAHLCHNYYGDTMAYEKEFVEWIPYQNKSEILRVSAHYTDVSGTLIENTTAIKGIFVRLGAQFAKMYKRKAFLHWYKGEGFDEMEFQEADANVRHLVTAYQDKQDAIVDVYSDGEMNETELEESDDNFQNQNEND